MSKYIIFFATTGEIMCSGEYPEEEGEFVVDPNYALLINYPSEVAIDDNTMLIDILNEELLMKAASPVTVDKTTVNAYGGDFITLSSIPVNALLKIEGTGFLYNGAVTSPTEDIDFDTIGLYTVTVTAFPYLPFEQVINVVSY